MLLFSMESPEQFLIKFLVDFWKYFFISEVISTKLYKLTHSRTFEVIPSRISEVAHENLPLELL